MGFDDDSIGQRPARDESGRALFVHDDPAGVEAEHFGVTLPQPDLVQRIVPNGQLHCPLRLVQQRGQVAASPGQDKAVEARARHLQLTQPRRLFLESDLVFGRICRGT